MTQYNPNYYGEGNNGDYYNDNHVNNPQNYQQFNNQNPDYKDYNYDNNHNDYGTGGYPPNVPISSDNLINYGYPPSSGQPKYPNYPSNNSSNLYPPSNSSSYPSPSSPTSYRSLNNNNNDSFSTPPSSLPPSSNNVTYSLPPKNEYDSIPLGSGEKVEDENSAKNLTKNNNNNNNNNDIAQRGSTIFSANSRIAFMKDDDEKQNKKHGGLMKYLCCGSKSSCGKTCAIVCCVILLIIIAIVAAVLLWARPPEVEFLGVGPPPNGLSPYVAHTKGFDFNFGLQIRVNNPNIVGAKFSMIKAVAFYPGHSTPIGGGNLTDVKIEKKANTTIDFPFSILYNSDTDPGFSILLDIATKCGLTGGQKVPLVIDYTLTLSLKVILITVSPTFNKQASINCPIENGQIPNIPGFNISNFSGQKLKRDFSTSLNHFL